MWKRILIVLVLMLWRNIFIQGSSTNDTDNINNTFNEGSFNPALNGQTKSNNLFSGQEVEVTQASTSTENNIATSDDNAEVLGDIQNIKIEAIYHSERNKVILHISWTNSMVLDHLDSYIFKIIPKPTFPECDDKTHETIKKDIGITSIYLPTPQHSYEVKPGCTYKINLVADFLHFGKISKDIDYTLPECVGKKCSCRNLKPILTSFTVSEIKTAGLKISWRLQSQTNNKINDIQWAIFEYRPVVSEFHHNNPFRRLSTKNDFSNNTYYVVIGDAQNDFRSGEQYQLRAMFNNSYNCKTYEYTNFTVTAPLLEVTPFKGQTIDPEPKSNYLLLIILSVILVIFFTLTIAYFLRRNRLVLKEILLNPISFRFSRRNRHPDTGSLYYVVPSGNKKQQEVNLLYIDKEILDGCVDHYELPRSRIVLIREIGEGAFGQVFLAKAFGIQQQAGYTFVAVKTLREKVTPEEMDDFLSEIEMLKRVGEHPNIVRLFGCCILKEPYLMVMEFVPCGDLKHYLLNLREKWQKKRTKSDTTDSSSGSYIIPNNCRYRTLSDDRPSIAETEYTILESDGYPTPTDSFNNKIESNLDHTELQNFALQIARGMEHLEKIPIAHRDLAARNILINEFKTLKISDFGLSRVGPYVNSKTKKMPLRWVAIEAIEDNFYDSKSDVWSFAVVLWEIGTLGAFPYDNVLDALVPHYLASGKRLPRPEICTDELYALMLKCWSHDPQERPSFQELVELLDSKKRRIYVDFNQLNPLYLFPPSTLQEVVNQTSNMKN